MFETYDFDYIMESMLQNIPSDIDKREGSIIYDALAPVAMELANFYINLDMVLDEAYADSASYYYLAKRAAERGVYPKEETYAIGKMVVTPTDTIISTNDRFNLDELNYTVIGPIEGEQGAFKIQCETEGVIGNQQLGTLLPIEFIEGLETAELTEILIPGEDEEEVESFREKYFESFSSESFGGNKADYKSKVNGIGGVGGCKVLRKWEDGYSPDMLIPNEAVKTFIESQTETSLGKDVFDWIQAVYKCAAEHRLTTGGTVEILIISSEYKSPSDSLIQMLQDVMDPGNTGEGDGLAPIGHVVTVKGVKSVSINVECEIEYDEGYSFDTLKDSIENTIESYFLQLRSKWSESEGLIVRINQIESNILAIEGIIDIKSTKLNGSSENITLEYDSIPIRGDVIG